MSRSLLSLALVSLVALVGVAGCERTDDPVPKHVIFVTVDTLRADHLTPYGYGRDTSPRLARLAEEGVLFERAVAQWPKTGVSFASIFTGLFPQTTGLTHQAALRVPDGYFTLPKFMQQLGFRTVAVVSNGVLGERLGWDRGFDEYEETWKLAPESSDDPVEYRRWLEAGVVNQLALPLIERNRDAERLFAWIHYSDPHGPYYLPDGVDNPFVGDELYVGDQQVELDRPRATRLGDATDLKYYVAQYDANILYMDQRFGELLDHLDDLGLLDDSLVVFTADHGESLGEHGYYFGHGRLPHNPGSVVPWVMWSPRALPEPSRIARPVELVDLFPTLAEIVAPDAEPVPELEGQSLVPLIRGDDAALADPRPLAFAQAGGGTPTTHFRSVQDPRWKLVFHPPMKVKGDERPMRWELYDLDNDPAELVDLSDEEPEELRRLQQELRDWMEDAGAMWIRRSADQIESYSQETLDALRALGYVQ